MKKKILFVDDEPEILSGLRRMLRKFWHEWDMVFAESGQMALKFLEETPFDVVVTDMRMPGMDGAELLERVARRYPGTVRIVLSGYSDQDMVMRTVSVAHQYLSKPCDADELKRVIEQAAVLRDTIYNDRVKEVVSGMETVPSCPSLYLKVTEALKSPDISLQAIGEIIAKDVGMTAKILQLVNSAFFGLPRKITNITQAVGILGLETIRTLVLMAGVFRAFGHVRFSGFNLESLWEHAMTVGRYARALGEDVSVPPGVSDAIYLAGMLHDVGKFILAASFSEGFGKILEISEKEGRPLYQVEWEKYQTSHAEVGGYLMGIWGLPDDIVTAIAFHHVPTQAGVSQMSPLLFVHLANGFSHLPLDERRDWTREFPEVFDREFLSRVGVLDKMAAWEETCRKIQDSGRGNGE